MQLNNLITALFNTGIRQNVLKMFGRRRKNRGIMWASLIGLGLSAATFAFRRNRNNNMLNPFQKLINNMNFRKAGKMPNMTALTEFSKEIMPNKNPMKNK